MPKINFNSKLWVKSNAWLNHKTEMSHIFRIQCAIFEYTFDLRSNKKADLIDFKCACCDSTDRRMMYLHSERISFWIMSVLVMGNGKWCLTFLNTKNVWAKILFLFGFVTSDCVNDSLQQSTESLIFITDQIIIK